MKSLLDYFILAGCLGLLGACGERGQPVPPPPVGVVSGWPASRSTDGGSFEVTIAPAGGAIGHNAHFSLEVSVVAKTGDVADIELGLNADMPAHGHGMNTKPELVALGEGRFRADGMLFHMGGDWVITATVTSDGEIESATFPIEIE